MHKIVDVFTKQSERPGYSRMVSLNEITDNDYNLNIPRYIDPSVTEDLHDLRAHLQGGIPDRDIDVLEEYWKVFPSLREILFASEREGYSKILVKASEIKSTILNHPEFKRFAAESLVPFTEWSIRSNLKGIEQGEQPKAIIHRLGEDLLQSYMNTPLLNRYDIYQILMSYWEEVMQDDVYVIVQDGWSAANVLRELVTKKGEKLKETPDLVIGRSKYRAELIPPALVVVHFFADKQLEVGMLQSDLDKASQALESFLEEHSVEDGLLNNALNEQNKVTKTSIMACLKLVTDPEERDALNQAINLFDDEFNAKKALKKVQDELDLQVFKQYAKLTEEEIKTLLVDNKWLTSLENNIVAEIERMTQQLANRVNELEERYAEPLPELTQSVAELSDKVAAHLKAMGLEWEL